MLGLTVLVCILISSALAPPVPDDLVIKLHDGLVHGTTYITKTNKTYFGFQGIPYAAPPTGSLRFEAPQPPKPWDGVWDATKDGKACLSVLNEKDVESEDCLNINVYTPAIKPAIKLPVMFWIYGGGFTAGSSIKWVYGPDFLVEKDVIVVTFNYRLASFGFLSTGDKAILGNAGLKDQNLALKWTHENIEYFGGDPKKITIFGQSAGGASTGLHLLSKKSAGLFRAAIVQSGSALNYWTIDQDPKSYALSLVAALNGGNYENDTQKLKEFLQGKTTQEILDATISITDNGHQLGPVLEVENESAFITESPYELLASGRFNQVPIIIGICAEEALMFLNDLGTAKNIAFGLDLFPKMVIPTNLQPNASNENAVIIDILNIYLEAGNRFTNNLVALAKVYTESGFTRGITKHAELAAKYVPVYLYQFAYYGRVIIEAFIDGAEHAGHSADLPFLFTYGTKGNTTDPADVLTQNRMTTLWTNFAKFLNPTPERSELLNNTIWKASTKEPLNLQFLNINDTVELRPNPKIESYKSWNNIYEKYGKRPFITY